ncbi:ABC transporter substrate-binding protein [Desulfogranum mediterraneum]|uniref:ABC transporter substrate-binding protein n=1 Tax=Desulfogranum mediterraneum TaxID=160661 RepID=UPI00042A2323|nr:ABC transporter substrate-binding protein [Desulfogranum mediterraneum]
MKSSFIQRVYSQPFFRECIVICLILPLTIIGSLEITYAGPKYGGSLQVADEMDARGFDAIQTRALVGNGGTAANLVMERLFKMDKDKRLIPVLGLSASPSSDGKTWTIRLREGVFFHDGTPFNADAVVQHWQRILNPKNRYSNLLLLQPIKSVEKTGNYEVRFNLEHPWYSFTAVLASPYGLAALIPSPTAVTNDTQNKAPVGTGPFFLKQWKRGDRIILVRNPRYWQAGKPYLDKIVLRTILDHEARYAATVSGQVDLMITDRPNHIKNLTEHSEFTSIFREPTGAYILAFNTSKPPLDDVRVRRAVAYAWDQKKYLKASYKNTMKFAENWYGNRFGCNETGYLHPDLEKAKALIAEYGKPVEVTYHHTPTIRGRETGEILQQMLKPIGVSVKLVPADWAAIIKQVFSKEYNIATWAIWNSQYETEPYTMASFNSQSPRNITQYNNKEVDTLLLDLRTSMDPAKRRAAFCKIGRQVNHDAPFLYLCAPVYHAFAGKTLRNLPIWRDRFLPLSDVWLDK